MKQKSGLLIKQDKHDKLTAVCLDCSSENQFVHSKQQEAADEPLSCMHVMLVNDELFHSH